MAKRSKKPSKNGKCLEWTPEMVAAYNAGGHDGQIQTKLAHKRHFDPENYFEEEQEDTNEE